MKGQCTPVPGSSGDGQLWEPGSFVGDRKSESGGHVVVEKGRSSMKSDARSCSLVVAALLMCLPLASNVLSGADGTERELRSPEFQFLATVPFGADDKGKPKLTADTCGFRRNAGTSVA